jgi:HemY protein
LQPPAMLPPESAAPEPEDHDEPESTPPPPVPANDVAAAPTPSPLPSSQAQTQAPKPEPVIPLVHAPDDPGPDVVADEETETSEEPKAAGWRKFFG